MERAELSRRPLLQEGDTVQLVNHRELPRHFQNETWLGRLGKVYAMFETPQPPRLDVITKYGSKRWLVMVDFYRKGNTRWTIRRTVPAKALEKLED